MRYALIAIVSLYLGLWAWAMFKPKHEPYRPSSKTEAGWQEPVREQRGLPLDRENLENIQRLVKVPSYLEPFDLKRELFRGLALALPTGIILCLGILFINANRARERKPRLKSRTIRINRSGFVSQTIYGKAESEESEDDTGDTGSKVRKLRSRE